MMAAFHVCVVAAWFRSDPFVTKCKCGILECFLEVESCFSQDASSLLVV